MTIFFSSQFSFLFRPRDRENLYWIRLEWAFVYISWSILYCIEFEISMKIGSATDNVHIDVKLHGFCLECLFAFVVVSFECAQLILRMLNQHSNAYFVVLLNHFIDEYHRMLEYISKWKLKLEHSLNIFPKFIEISVEMKIENVSSAISSIHPTDCCRYSIELHVSQIEFKTHSKHIQWGHVRLLFQT